MRKKTLGTRISTGILSLVFLASLLWTPIPAAKAATTQTIPITVGGKTYNVTPGQWVTVNTPGGTTSYNVRFVNGKPVALEMSQYQQIIFGDAGSSSAAAQTGVSTGSTGSTNSGASQSSNPTAQTGNAGAVNTGNSSSGAAQTSGSSAQTSGSSAQTTTPASSGNTQMTWNEFQKANAGKGMSNAEMGKAWRDYKAGNTGAGGTSSGASQSSGATAQTGNSGSAPAPQTSVAEGAPSTGATGTGGTQASGADASATTSQSTSNWDPTKHPRDPQTGKFISHEEAIARGLMDPADANTSGSSSQSSQTAQSGEAGQSSGSASQSSTETAQGGNGSSTGSESGASAQTAQAATEGTAASGEKTKTSIGDKFKAGYEAGKGMTQQGIQNVKDSLKSGFSAKNLLVTAGITVGVDLATQIMRGEQPSLKSALKTVCSAEFVGSVAGSTLGAAAGSFFTPFLSAIPVVGGVLSALAPTFGSVVGSSVGAYVAGDLKNGRFSIKEAFKRIDWVGVAGQTIGSTAGAALGSCLGPVGTVIGGMVGGYLGNWAAHKIAGLFGKGSANLPPISMPTGTTGNEVSTADSITIGGSDVTSVTISDEVVTVADDEVENKTSVEASDVDEKITAAYEEYTEYYTQYSKLIQEGKTEEALAIAEKMNQAKAAYDSLRYKD